MYSTMYTSKLASLVRKINQQIVSAAREWGLLKHLSYNSDTTFALLCSGYFNHLWHVSTLKSTIPFHPFLTPTEYLLAPNHKMKRLPQTICHCNLTMKTHVNVKETDTAGCTYFRWLAKTISAVITT